jgi:hypothetical protein
MSAEDERWHVRIAPDEVKTLTLEQVDDLFRLEMIDENTLLCQEGTSDWLPLRVVAGLDEEEPAVTAPASAPAPIATPVRSAPPPPPPPLSAPSERAPFAPSPSFAPPPVSAPSTSVAPPKPASSSLAPPAPPPPSFAPPAPALASVAPPALSFTPPEVPLPAPARASRAETWLIGLAAALGLLVTLQRNGVLQSLFAATGQAASYAKLEASLGGPGFGTVRAVDALVAAAPEVGKNTHAAP